jgi:hypothetical protein
MQKILIIVFIIVIFWIFSKPKQVETISFSRSGNDLNKLGNAPLFPLKNNMNALISSHTTDNTLQETTPLDPNTKYMMVSEHTDENIHTCIINKNDKLTAPLYSDKVISSYINKTEIKDVVNKWSRPFYTQDSNN